MHTPTHRKALNPKQLFLLNVLFKFRFVTAKVIANSVGLSEKVVYRRLKNLYDQGYLERRYDETSRITGQAAVYSLAPKAIRYLKSNTGLNDGAIHNAYFNNRKDQGFINHQLHVYEMFIVFKRWYGKQMTFFTKNELYDYTIFPKQLPDGYITLKRPDKADKEYILELFDNSIPLFSITNKIKAYKKHHQAEVWEGTFPALLFICESPRLERRIQQTVQRVFGIIEDVNVYTTSLKALLNAQSKSEAIWSNAKEPESLLSF